MCRFFEWESITLILISACLFDVCQNHQSSHNKIRMQFLAIPQKRFHFCAVPSRLLFEGRILAGGKMAALNLVQFGVLLSFRIIVGMYFTLKHFLQALTVGFQGLRVKECGNFSISNPCETVISLK